MISHNGSIPGFHTMVLATEDGRRSFALMVNEYFLSRAGPPRSDRGGAGLTVSSFAEPLSAPPPQRPRAVDRRCRTLIRAGSTAREEVPMAIPLVESKFFRPTLRAGIVARPSLVDRLVGDSRVVLLSAPAGFGKTTLLVRWLAGADTDGTRGGTAEDPAVAWVSLDDGDRDPSSFWTYVITAVDRAVPGVGAGALALLQAGQEPIEAIVAAVLNELSVLPGSVTVVLDDYHRADGPALRPGMSFMVDHLPPQLRLVISTRADPELPLARLRARAELTEVRAADLRFTPPEAAAYLNDVAGLRLTPDQIATLEERTEGWVAALQLAALSLRGRDDPAGFIAGFAGDDRFVVDYLVKEVLNRQPEQARRFLLKTSVLDRLTGALCDAVTGDGDGRAMLERLERTNLFVVPLDDQRRWYRYHHLFGEVLRTHLTADPEEVAELHRRASDWYHRAGDTVAAVRHALAAGDVDRAADLVELAIPALRRHRQEATLRRWIDDFPRQLVARRPVLAMGFVGALMASNEFGDVQNRLRDLERLLADTGAGPPAGWVVVDEREFARLPAAAQMYRAALALIGGDPAGTLDHARRAAGRAPEDDDLTRSSAAALAGLASWTLGDLDAAHRSYTDAAAGLRSVGYIPDVLGCTIALADLETTQGTLNRAQRTYEQALDLAGQHDAGMRGTRDMYVGLCRLAVERNDLTTAAEHLRRGEDLGEQAGLPQNAYRWRVALALLREAQGDVDTALGLLTDAERVYTGDFSPNVQPLPALRARMLAAHGRWEPATQWAHRHGLTPADELSYLREYEHLTLARVLLAQHAADGSPGVLRDVVALLEGLLAAADAGGRDGTVIEVLTLSAVAQRESGHEAQALTLLRRALAMAEPQGYVRVFATAGPAMTALLKTMRRQDPSSAYLPRLLDASTGPHPQPDDAAALDRAARGGLVDPLSPRELDVMRLLLSELDGPSIARQLVVSLNTVRTHTKNIYAKLGVTNRRAAVRRAHQLNLL
ncbi:MAG TPA: LuxR C-terminal-related transcriptional regulator [Actinoplanes sp.]